MEGSLLSQSNPDLIGVCSPVFLGVTTTTKESNYDVTRLDLTKKFKASQWRQGYQELREEIEEGFTDAIDKINLEIRTILLLSYFAKILIGGLFIYILILILDSFLNWNIPMWSYTVFIVMWNGLLLVWSFYKLYGVIKELNTALRNVQEQHPEYEIKFKPRRPCGANYGVVEIYKTY